jgi:hypothetical protein
MSADVSENSHQLGNNGFSDTMSNAEDFCEKENAGRGNFPLIPTIRLGTCLGRVVRFDEETVQSPYPLDVWKSDMFADYGEKTGSRG